MGPRPYSRWGGSGLEPKDQFSLGSRDYNTLAFAAPDLSLGSTSLYYLRSTTDLPETGVFWGVGVFGMLLATWQWRRRVRAQGLAKVA